MKGQVYKSTGNWYQVKKQDGQFIQARIKGVFRLDHTRATNPIAVGDFVQLAYENGDWLIDAIEDRNNYFLRESPKNRTARHIIAANMDQIIVLACMAKPRTSSGFIDRCLVTAQAYRVPAVVIFNKTDLYREKENNLMHAWMVTYRKIGVEVIQTSVVTEQHIDQVGSILKNKVSLLIGHSGAGKSSLVNKIDPSLDLRTGEISEVHEKGKHTTTFAEMFDLSGGGAVIDTPGIKEFGLLDIEKQELGHFFPEFVSVMHQCKFNNCLHVSEPQCAVIEAVRKGDISEVRYLNYLNMLEDIEEGMEKWELK